MENNICSKMNEAVTAMCSFVAEENIKRVQNLIGEVKRYFPTFAKLLSSDVVLRDADETNLRKLRDWITSFEKVENPRLKNIPEWLDDKAYKDYLSLLSMVKETIKGYFVPPTFEPQQVEQTYKLLFANRLAIAEVMGISADSFANKLKKWLEEYKESLSVVPDAKGERSYSGGLLDLFHNNTDLIAELVGLSDDEIARKIKGWAKEKDKLGKPLIENPENGLKLRFAEELKANGIIKLSIKTFRTKL